MAISFPGGSKSNGQKFTHQNKSWTWDGNSWKGGVSSGSDAGTLDSLNSTQFLRSDATGGTTGSFGIGTTSPDFNLHVKKDATGAIGKFEGTTGRFIYTGTDAGGQYIEQVGTTAAERKLRIQSSNGSSTYTSLTIDGANQLVYTDGNAKVGINNTSPQGVLSIHGGTGTSYSEVESLNSVNFYKFFKVIDTARSLQMENIFIMPVLSNGQKYIHFVTTMQGAMGFDLDILCGRSGSERMFGRVGLRGYKYHESDGDYRHGAIESTSSMNAYGNYFEINGPVTQYLADSATATQESYTNPGSYWITRIPCYFNGGGSGQVEFTAFLKTMHHNTAPGGTYYMGIV
jgi:hypothetical protein